ncbi:MAG: hypothetical protein KAX31_01710, partial [Thermoplasmata archaeon]|nr:hypothetical protein [Thermoplasmata archaeon]
MELELNKGSFPVFRDWIDMLKTVNEEMTLHVDEEGIQTMSMDPSHVAMIEASIKAELFDKFKKPEGKHLITLSLSEFSKFLDRVDKDESAKISYQEDKAKLFIHTKKGGRRRRFSLPVLEPLEDEVPKPKIFFKSEARILTQSVVTAIKDASLVSEHIAILFTKDMLKISATGDMGSAVNEFDKGSDEFLELKAEEDASATFTLSYLAD